MLDVVQDPRDSVLLRPGQLRACRGTRSLGGWRTSAACRSIPPWRKAHVPPRSLLLPWRGRHPRASTTASGELVHCVWGPGRGAGREADGWVRAGEGGPELAAGRKPAGRGARRGSLLYACRGSEQGAAGRRHYSPSSICPSHSLTLGKGGGPRREGERGGRVGKGIDVGPSLPRSMPGRERRCHRTPSSQIECGLTIRRRTEDSRRLGRGRSSGPAPRLSFRLAPGVLLRVLDRGPPTLTFGGQSASYSQQSVPLAQSPTPRTPFPTQGSRQHACFLSCFNLAGRSGRPQPVSNS